ncbi:MAG TPA: TolC family protein, partial [Acidocella sp.]|nr:TolC family protein [Acidocella sp.]
MRRAAFLIPLGLGACALGPNYTPPTPPAGSAAPFSAASASTTTAGNAPDEWWRLYDDPVLNGLIEEAFAKNEDLQVAEQNLASSRAIYEGARNLFFPQTVTAMGGTYGRDPVTNEILILGGHKPQTIWKYDAALDVSYELDLFGHVRRSVEAARDSTEAVAAARDELRVTIAAETARAYGQICALGEQINVANEALALAQKQQQIIQQQYDAGAGTQFDIVRAQVVVTQARAALPPLLGEREVAL